MNPELRTLHLLVGDRRRLVAWSHGENGRVEAPATGGRWTSTAPHVVSLDRSDGAVVVIEALQSGASTLTVEHSTTLNEVEQVEEVEVLWEAGPSDPSWGPYARKPKAATVQRVVPRLKTTEKVVSDYLRVVVHDQEAAPRPHVLVINVGDVT
jgi:hypothetical protein